MSDLGAETLEVIDASNFHRLSIGQEYLCQLGNWPDKSFFTDWTDSEERPIGLSDPSQVILNFRRSSDGLRWCVCWLTEPSCFGELPDRVLSLQKVSSPESAAPPATARYAQPVDMRELMQRMLMK